MQSMMRQGNQRLWRASAALAVLSFACSAPEDLSSLVGTATPKSINNTGETATIRVTATDSAGKPGTGSVTFSSPAGSLVQAVTVPLSGGAAETTFSCTLAQDTRCVGDVRVRVTWARASGDLATTVRVSLPAAPSDGGGGGGGGGDGGAGGGDGGTPDGGGGGSVLGSRYVVGYLGPSASGGELVLQNIDDGGVLFGVSRARSFAMNSRGIFFVDANSRVFQYGPDVVELINPPPDLDGGADAGDVDAGDVDAGDADAGTPDAGDVDGGADAGDVWRLPVDTWKNDSELTTACDAGVSTVRVGADGELWFICNGGGQRVVAREGATKTIELDGGLFQAGGPNGSLFSFRAPVMSVFDAAGREHVVTPTQTINWVAASITVTSTGYRFPAYLEQAMRCGIVEVTHSGGFNLVNLISATLTGFVPVYPAQPFNDCTSGVIDADDPKSILVLLKRTSDNAIVVVRRSQNGPPVVLTTEGPPASVDLATTPPVLPVRAWTDLLLLRK